MSFHPPKNSPQSSSWFHNDAWLSFNSIQHWPEDQIAAIAHDWDLTPPKPTWVFEPRYEGYWRKPYRAADWGDWQMRQQAWQSVLSGGFGFTYGHERIFGFGEDGWDWKTELDAPGANQMRHLVKLVSLWGPDEYFTRLPDQSLLDGDTGKAERLTSDRRTAMRNADATLTMIYSADGSDIRLRMDRLAGKRMTASWFNPRNGLWRVGDTESDRPRPFAKGLDSGPGATVRVCPPVEGRGIGWFATSCPATPKTGTRVIQKSRFREGEATAAPISEINVIPYFEPFSLVPMLRVGMPSATLRVVRGVPTEEAAERPGRHDHAERGNEVFGDAAEVVRGSGARLPPSRLPGRRGPYGAVGMGGSAGASPSRFLVVSAFGVTRRRVRVALNPSP